MRPQVASQCQAGPGEAHGHERRKVAWLLVPGYRQHRPATSLPPRPGTQGAWNAILPLPRARNAGQAHWPGGAMSPQCWCAARHRHHQAPSARGPASVSAHRRERAGRLEATRHRASSAGFGVQVLLPAANFKLHSECTALSGIKLQAIRRMGRSPGIPAPLKPPRGRPARQRALRHLEAVRKLVIQRPHGRHGLALRPACVRVHACASVCACT